MDLLGNLTEEGWNTREADRLGMREPIRGEKASLLLAGLPTPVTLDLLSPRLSTIQTSTPLSSLVPARAIPILVPRDYVQNSKDSSWLTTSSPKTEANSNMQKADAHVGFPCRLISSALMAKLICNRSGANPSFKPATAPPD
jgi:hypothetical protein